MYLTVKEAAELMNVSLGCIYYHIKTSKKLKNVGQRVGANWHYETKALRKYALLKSDVLKLKALPPAATGGWRRSVKRK